MIAIGPGFSYIAKKLSDMAQILKYVLNQIRQLHTKNQNLYSLVSSYHEIQSLNVVL